ncbi:MAG: M3 family metallopeptidase [Proteobacteria bacterium]|nr:M3 family metallopeptidase [Pseudomonadota bacterium]
MAAHESLFRPGIPQFEKITIESMIPALEGRLLSCNSRFQTLEDKIATGRQLTWHEIFDPIDEIDIELLAVWGPILHLFGVQNSPELRKVYEHCQPKIVEFGLRMSQSRLVYKAVLGLSESAEYSQILNSAQRRIVDLRLLDAKLSGIGLEGAKKDRFNEVSQKLASISMNFSNHVLDSTKAWSMDLRDLKDVAQLPQRVLEMASSEFNKFHNSHESSAEKGPWRFTLDGPSYLAFMDYSPVRSLKESMYRARLTIASEGSWDNSGLILEILNLRAEKAKLLGFESFAEMSLASKMAAKIENVGTLLEDLRSASYTHGMKEHQDLIAFAKGHGADYDIQEWDVPYWSRIMKEETYHFNEDELRPYFPMPKVLTGLFSLVSRIFAIEVKSADQEAAVWDKDVHFFKIFDKRSSKHIASFFLDPYSRPQNKRGGAWMADCVTRHVKDGVPSIPVAYLICNGTNPVGQKPSLMSFNEVLTLFHEFGHGLQHMLTEVDYFGVSGINGVEWDAVELASQFMENWLYDTRTLKELSGHYETHEPMPVEFIHKIKSAKNFRSATAMLRQIQFAMIDMALHHGFDPNKDSLLEVQARMARLSSAFPPRPESRFLCSFSHIFSGGYSAGYYSYKWAEVLSADAFGAFEEVGLENESKIQEVGLRYRSTVLGKGGSEHPMKVFNDFRGRGPQTTALLMHNGLAL